MICNFMFCRFFYTIIYKANIPAKICSHMMSAPIEDKTFHIGSLHKVVHINCTAYVHQNFIGSVIFLIS